MISKIAGMNKAIKIEFGKFLRKFKIFDPKSMSIVILKGNWTSMISPPTFIKRVEMFILLEVWQ